MFIYFVCICALCTVFKYLCLHDVQFLKLAIWLLTQQVNKHESNNNNHNNNNLLTASELSPGGSGYFTFKLRQTH
jgi:hypothetical protein